MKTFELDRPFLENKYHDTNQPFNPYRRMQYHGWECDESTGETDEQILNRLQQLAIEYKDRGHAFQKAAAVSYVLDHSRIDVNEHDYFFTFYSWGRLVLNSTVKSWKTQLFDEIIPDTKENMELLNRTSAANIWPDFDHVVPLWDDLFELGFTGLLKRVRYYQQKHSENGTLDAEKADFFTGMDMVYSAILRLIKRIEEYALTCKHDKASLIAESMHRLYVGAPVTFLDALECMYLYFIVCECVDCYQTRSLGNGLDQSLLKFYKKDMEKGRYTREELKEFMAYFLFQFSAIGNYWGHPFYLGGTDKNGNSLVNDLSYDILSVYREIKIYNPKIQIKVNHNTPKAFLNLALDMIRTNAGSIVFCSEPAMRDAIMNYGATLEEATDFDIRGCYETGVKGKEVSAATGYINTLKAVRLLFTDGMDENTGEQVGVPCALESITCFEDVYTAFLNQWGHLIEQVIASANAYDPYLSFINPSPVFSATIEDSLQKGIDAYCTGMKYNNSAVLNCGFASAVDALMAIKEFVFEKQKITLKELGQALDDNWVGYETLRYEILNSKHKYGSGDSETDIYAAALSRWFCSKVNNRPNGRGGVYKAILHSAMEFVWQGEKTGATPDGRKAGDEISKNASPAVGMDKNGVTALITSVTKLVPYLYSESFCLDVMLHPTTVEGDEGLDVMYSLLMTYIQKGGMSIQLNIFNADTLRDAQAHPEKYTGLQVRVCGWNVLWNNLSRAEQNAYIHRAENIQQ